MKLEKFLSIFVFMTLSLTLTLSCGAEEEDDEDKTETFVSMTATTDAGQSSYSLTSVDSCTFDSQTDSFSASFSTGENSLTKLTVDLTGLTGENGTKTCTLSELDDTDFEGCGVLFQIPNTEENASGYDQYSMYNDNSLTDTLTYNGACEIQWGRSETRFTGEITCSGLVQTHRKSVARNPLDNSVTANLTNTQFYCDYNQ